jgi:anti-sigma regulatory factor (Ser/Thr protein kinase)
VSSPHARLELPAEPASVRQARSFVRRVLDSWELDGLADTAALLVSELATNVVLHARTPYAVVVARTRKGAVVDVLDLSGEPPQLRTHDPASATGRGLALVAALANEWGATPATDLAGFAKGVRFTLA